MVLLPVVLGCLVVLTAATMQASRPERMKIKCVSVFPPLLWLGAFCRGGATRKWLLVQDGFIACRVRVLGGADSCNHAGVAPREDEDQMRECFSALVVVRGILQRGCHTQMAPSAGWFYCLSC